MDLQYKPNHFEKYVYLQKKYTWVGNFYPGTVRPAGSQTRSNFKCTWRHKPCNRKPIRRSVSKRQLFLVSGTFIRFMFRLFPVWVLLYFISSLTQHFSLSSIRFHTSFLLSSLRVCRYIGWWLRKGVWLDSHFLVTTNCYEDRSRIVFSYVTYLFGPSSRENKMLFEIFNPPPT